MIYRVNGHSMEPTLREGDFVVALPLKPREGDVVVVEKGGIKMVKRFLGGSVKGDAPCSRAFKPDRIVGKVLLRITR